MSKPFLHQVLVSEKVGGAAVVAIKLAAAGQRRGFLTRAWVPAAGPASDALDAQQVPWADYNLAALWGAPPKQLLSCARILLKLGGLGRPVVHVHNPMVFRIMRPALVAARARTVVHFQIEPHEEEIQWTLSAPPEHTVVCARYIADKIRGVLGEPGATCRISVVPNAIDVSRYSAVPRTASDQRFDGHPFVVLMMASLSPHKGHRTTLRAVRVLRDRGIPVECWFAGEDRSDGKECEMQLHSLCSELGLAEHVRFLGFRTDGSELLHRAHALVLPSTHEGLPLCLLEAQAARVPVVGAPIPGILEVVNDGETGFIVAADDHVGYADRLQALFLDSGVRERIVDAAAKQVTAEYGWEAYEQRVFDIYAELAG